MPVKYFSVIIYYLRMSFQHLGQKSLYPEFYSPDLLQAVDRKHPKHMPKHFFGFDLWWAYEISWLNDNNKPEVAIAEIIFPASSPIIVESKSLKLYFNSFNMHNFDSKATVQAIIRNDLTQLTQSSVSVKLLEVDAAVNSAKLDYTCLDNIDTHGNFTNVDASLLKNDAKPEIVSERLVSHLLKSNCLVTKQPDWGSIFIEYTGRKINHTTLLQYIISYRNHIGFHEHCVDLCFADILQQCQPEQLTVRAQYTRRGGIDINPVRSTTKTDDISLKRIPRQ